MELSSQAFADLPTLGGWHGPVVSVRFWVNLRLQLWQLWL